MLYEVTVNGQLLGQQYINRYNYNSTGTPASVSGSFGLMSAIGAIPDGLTDEIPSDGILQQFLGGVSSSLAISSVMVAALYDVEDFYELPYPTPLAGSQSTDCPSPALSYALRTNIVRTDIARGRKFLGGVNESHIQPGGTLDSTIVTHWTDFCALISDTLTYDDEGNTLTYVPCVLSKQEYTTPSGKRAYKKYTTLSAQLEHTALGVAWQLVSTVRTTRSRQYGHGA